MNNAEIEHILTFAPHYKEVIWGGERIARIKGDTPDGRRIGESWEISAIPDAVSVVDSGPLKGTTLNQLIERFGDALLGTRSVAQFGLHFPILVKILDVSTPLSLQVHPDDELAMRRHGCSGKAEMWYIIDTDTDAHLYCGLSRPLDPDKYRTALTDNSMLGYVQRYQSEPGQFYYVPAGTLHAIGAGNLIAEIQQSSDITYRVWDYDRRDAHGCTRQLHTEQAIDAIDYTYPSAVVPAGRKCIASADSVVASPFFTVGYKDLRSGQQVDRLNNGESFVVIMIVEGTATITTGTESRTLSAGHTALLPAAVREFSICGDAKVLTVSV